MRPVVGVDDQGFAYEVGLELGRRALVHDPAAVDDADPVGLLGLLEVVGRQEDRRAALRADRPEVVPQRSAARRIEAGRRLVEEQHTRPVQQAADDLELAAHAARERPDRLEDFALDAEHRGQLPDLVTVWRAA